MECKICGLIYAKRDSLLRHYKAIHQKSNLDDTSETEEEDDDVETDGEEEDDDVETDGEDNNKCIFDTEDENSTDYDDNAPLLIDKTERIIWKVIMQMVLNRMSSTVDDITDDDASFKEFVEKLGEQYEMWRQIIGKTKKKKIYSSIKETIDSHVQNGYLPSEAGAKAWKDRRLFIKKLLPIIFS